MNEFENLDNENRKLISEKEKLEQEKNLSKSKDKSNFSKSKKISEEISQILKKQSITEKKLNELLHIMPNLALDDVPLGKDDTANKIINHFGQIENFLSNQNLTLNSV